MWFSGKAYNTHINTNTHTLSEKKKKKKKKNGHLRWIKEPDLFFLPVSLKTYLNIHKINYQLN